MTQQSITLRDRLVLLGTKGGPFVSAYAPGPSCNLLAYRGSTYVVDAGYGVTLKLGRDLLELPLQKS